MLAAATAAAAAVFTLSSLTMLDLSVSAAETDVATLGAAAFWAFAASICCSGLANGKLAGRKPAPGYPV